MDRAHLSLLQPTAWLLNCRVALLLALNVPLDTTILTVGYVHLLALSQSIVPMEQSTTQESSLVLPVTQATI